jgi:hypothetical protein
MKKRSFLLPLIAAVSAFALLATPAEAGGRKKHCHRGWHDGGRVYYRGDWNNCGYRPYRPVYYRPARYYRPAYYNPGPVFAFGFSFY